MEAEDASKAEATGEAAEVGETAAVGDAGAAEDGNEWEDDPELDALKKKVKQMQEEAEGREEFCPRSCDVHGRCAALERIQQQAEQSTGGAIHVCENSVVHTFLAA